MVRSSDRPLLSRRSKTAGKKIIFDLLPGRILAGAKKPGWKSPSIDCDARGDPGLEIQRRKGAISEDNWKVFARILAGLESLGRVQPNPPCKTASIARPRGSLSFDLRACRRGCPGVPCRLGSSRNGAKSPLSASLQQHPKPIGRRLPVGRV